MYLRADIHKGEKKNDELMTTNAENPYSKQSLAQSVFTLTVNYCNLPKMVPTPSVFIAA